jgi:hypothetical protein
MQLLYSDLLKKVEEKEILSRNILFGSTCRNNNQYFLVLLNSTINPTVRAFYRNSKHCSTERKIQVSLINIFSWNAHTLFKWHIKARQICNFMCFLFSP